MAAEGSKEVDKGNKLLNADSPGHSEVMCNVFTHKSESQSLPCESKWKAFAVIRVQT